MQLVYGPQSLSTKGKTIARALKGPIMTIQISVVVANRGHGSLEIHPRNRLELLLADFSIVIVAPFGRLQSLQSACIGSLKAFQRLRVVTLESLQGLCKLRSHTFDRSTHRAHHIHHLGRRCATWRHARNNRRPSPRRSSRPLRSMGHKLRTTTRCGRGNTPRSTYTTYLGGSVPGIGPDILGKAVTLNCRLAS